MGPSADSKTKDPEIDAVKEEEETNADAKEAKDKTKKDGHDKVDGDSIKDGDSPSADSKTKDPEADAVKEENEKDDIVPEADAVKEEVKDKDSSGSIEETFVKEAEAVIDGHDIEEAKNDGEILRRKRRDANTVLKKRGPESAREKTVEEKSNDKEFIFVKKAEKGPESEAVKEAQNDPPKEPAPKAAEPKAQPDPNIQSSGPVKLGSGPTMPKQEVANETKVAADPAPIENAVTNGPVPSPVSDAAGADDIAKATAADDANKKSEVAEEELSKKINTIEGEVNKALEE